MSKLLPVAHCEICDKIEDLKREHTAASERLADKLFRKHPRCKMCKAAVGPGHIETGLYKTKVGSMCLTCLEKFNNDPAAFLESLNSTTGEE